MRGLHARRCYDLSAVRDAGADRSNSTAATAATDPGGGRAQPRFNLGMAERSFGTDAISAPAGVSAAGATLSGAIPAAKDGRRRDREPYPGDCFNRPMSEYFYRNSGHHHGTHFVFENQKKHGTP